MNQRGFSLIEIAISIGLLGFVGLFVGSYMDKLYSDSNKMHFRYEMMQLKNQLSENFNTVTKCKANLAPVIKASGLDANPAKSFLRPLSINVLSAPAEHKVVANLTVFGEVKIVSMELISSTLTPNLPLKKITRNFGKVTSQSFYRTMFKVTTKKANKFHSSLLFPIKITFANNMIEDCAIGSSSAPHVIETCSSILQEDGKSSFEYQSKNCKMRIQGQSFQVRSANKNENILCHLQKKIKGLKPLTPSFNPTHCP